VERRYHRDHGRAGSPQRRGTRAAAVREQGAEEEGDRASFISECYNKLGNEVTVAFLDELKDIGFRYATLSGLSIGIVDMHIRPPRAGSSKTPGVW